GDPIFYDTSRPQPYSPSLKWEETTTYNVGIDYGFFDNRIEGSIEAYFRETQDLLFFVSIPSGGGLSNADFLNIGSLENRGLEVTLNTTPIQTDNLTWTVGGNLTVQDTEITQIYDTQSDEFEGFLTGGFAGGVGNTIQIQSVGYNPNAFFVYEQAYDAQGNPLEGVYVDRNNDGVINIDDRYRYKKPAADVYYGFNTTLSYKNWDFSMFWRGSYGNYNYNNVQSNLGYRTQVLRYNNTLSNASTNVLETNFNDGGIDRYLSDYYIQDASFLKLDNISLGYTFNNLSDGNLSMKVYGTASNVLIISDYDGIDPEVGGGIDNTIYPRPRTFLFGINIDF
ncbi:MAG: TonB-dependent receptor, partial [Bacteroidota bacterium]